MRFGIFMPVAFAAATTLAGGGGWSGMAFAASDAVSRGREPVQVLPENPSRDQQNDNSTAEFIDPARLRPVRISHRTMRPAHLPARSISPRDRQIPTVRTSDRNSALIGGLAGAGVMKGGLGVIVWKGLALLPPRLCCHRCSTFSRAASGAHRLLALRALVAPRWCRCPRFPRCRLNGKGLPKLNTRGRPNWPEQTVKMSLTREAVAVKHG